MANYVFFDHPVDMRLEDDGYGVPLLQAAEAFAEAFVAVDTEVVTQTESFVSVVARNSLGQMLTTNYTRVPSSGAISLVTAEALDLRLYYYGSSLYIDAQGNLTGNISQSWAQVISTGAYIGKLSGFVAPFTEDGSADEVILAGSDLINGSSGNDYLLGYSDDDTINGANGNDTLDGGPGNDILYGDAGNDSVIGGEGNDQLNGGNGIDTLYGEGGADRFVFTQGGGADIVADFEDGVDLFDLRFYAGATIGNTIIAAQGADTLVTFTGGETALLVGIDSASITGADFMF